MVGQDPPYLSGAGIVMDVYYGDEHKIIDQIKSLNCPAIVTIDGIDGAGKSYLAKDISEKLNIDIIDSENPQYRDQGAGYFQNSYKLDVVKQKIDINKGKRSSIIFSSCCALSILEKINIKPTFKIYIKRINPNYPDTWDPQHARFFHYKLSTADKTISLFGVNGPVRLEVIKYHYDYQPDQSANLIYYRQKKEYE